MKPPINFLTLIFSLSVLTISLSSFDGCIPEPPPKPCPECFPPPEYRDENPPHIPRNPDDDSLDVGISDISLTLEEAMAKIDPDVHPDWGIAIKAYTCAGRGQTLQVYNPNAHSLSFYNSARFSVHWFKDGWPVRGNNIRLECVCKGKYAVVVLNKQTKQGIGIAFYNARACYAEAAAKKAIDS